MSTVQTFLKEFSQEAETTRKMLSIVPTDKYDWKPHPKSMTVRRQGPARKNRGRSTGP